ncbi:hypothetical protein [Pseudomonas sp. 273]|uniref:hypothetical protein n=1 Tax=Pseudomonas sp. 273 TaxID=75692 RepID=UPI0023D8897D|nr:hypothetical protein [Pseudomonas sp. 273]
MPNYKAAFESASLDLSAIMSLLGFTSYPGVDPMLRAITDLVLAKAEAQALRDQVKALQSDANSYQSGYDEGRRMGAKHRQSEVEQLTRKVEDLRARVVVVPDRFAPPTYAHHSLKDQAEGWNDCLDELARLNGKVVSERLLRKWLELMEHGDFSEGHCMCGSAVDSHGIGDGHAPVDAGEYYAGQVMEELRTLLSEGKQGDGHA